MRSLAFPVAPDPDEARRWAEEELSKTAYQEAEPTPIDRFARGVAEFLGSIFSGRVPDAAGPWLAVVAIAVIVVLVIVALVIWGRPRLAARSTTPAPLFGESEARSAVELRADADAAARRDDWDEAIILRVRALARGLAERTIVGTEPGATVHRFADAATRAFPSAASDLDEAARSFDDVRYLRRPGSRSAYEHVRDLDERLERSRAEVLA